MTDLKLLALDAEDLTVVSAHMQDAVFKPKDVEYAAKSGVFSIAANRFVWEKAKRKDKSFERRRAALTIKRVGAVRSLGFDRRSGEEVLALLAVEFHKKGEGPEGELRLVCAGGAAIALDVECIEVQLADLGGAWETTSRPRHPVK
ncbi:DUF2948 family protein [Allorhizobium sp. BGMRC 0089]|uniref:DUF2948 family protein n=1 Tax=Allorhizobium sonneratiae TaxID=2934936 RepID=UPI002033565B|nr:DUF2948 family protein [Allorhizobium sonneratiae]MCM2291443.1 DUF2948 family protein [Allorhizobium sonneratiae]